MKRYLLDTNAAADFIDREPKVVDRVNRERLQGARIGICVPVLAELNYGVENSATRDKNMQRLITGISRLPVWPFDRKAAAEFGRIFADLRRRGKVIGIIDMMTAAIAKTLGNTTIVSTDSDFQAIPGIDVEDWTK
jgi:tRNA(fMet)-specific endonuclease VapC